MKLGVITNGISRDLEYALQAMNKAGLKYAELQFLWDKEIGDQTPEEIQKIKRFGCTISGGNLLCFTTQFRRTSRDGN